MADKKETITAVMSRWAAGVRFEDLSQDAVYQAKRFLLDSVGCALGGYQQHDVVIALEVLEEVAKTGPATVIGSGKKMDVVHAALANALMIRCMDYNDIYWKQDPSHPSDIFPAAMACAERAKSDGRELIVRLGLRPLHAGRRHRRQADHDEEHGRPDGHRKRRPRSASRRERLLRPRARH